MGKNNQVWVIEHGVRRSITLANAVPGIDICIRDNNNVVILELPISAKSVV